MHAADSANPLRWLTLRNLGAAAVFSVAMAVAFLPGSYLRPQRFEFELEFTSDAPGTIQVFYSDGSGFHEASSSRGPIPAVNERSIVRLPIFPGQWSEFRLDPFERSGRFTVWSARVIARSGETVHALPVETMKPVHQIAAAEPRDGALELIVSPGHNDPQLAIALDPPLEIPPPWRQFVMLFSLPALGVFVALAGVLAGLDRRRRARAAGGHMADGKLRFGLAAALFLAVWGARLAVIDRFGSDLPYWDQWWKEGIQILIPWAERGELWGNIFAPHNEHRIVPTLAVNLALLGLGGQWDARVQCVMNALLPAAMVAALVLAGWRRLPRGWAAGLGLLAAMAAAVPIAWENIVGGFQSQFSFLIGFSFLAMGGVLGWPAFSWRWWLAIAAGVLSLFSMGSGFFWAVPVAGVAAVRFARGEVGRRDGEIMLGVAAVFVVVGWLLREAPPSHDVLHARTAWQLVTYTLRCLAWPLPQFPEFAVVLWAPWTLLAVVRLTGRRSLDGRVADFILAAGAWVLLQALAVAYARGASPGLPASRYGDVFMLGPLVGFAALAAMAPGWRRSQVAGVVFAGVLITATAIAGAEAWTRVTARGAEHVSFERTVRDFVHTDDFATFAQRPIPFPAAEELAGALRHPAIRAILPASVRPALKLPGFTRARPPEPSLEDRGTRFVSAPGRWESPLLPAATGWWKIETSGSPGLPGVSLALVAAANGRQLSPIAPSKLPGATWRAAYVPAPREPARFSAQVDAFGKWIAFSEPIEIPTLSYRVWQTAKQGLLILCLATSAAMALVILLPHAGLGAETRDDQFERRMDTHTRKR